MRWSRARLLATVHRCILLSSMLSIACAQHMTASFFLLLLSCVPVALQASGISVTRRTDGWRFTVGATPFYHCTSSPQPRVANNSIPEALFCPAPISRETSFTCWQCSWSHDNMAQTAITACDLILFLHNDPHGVVRFQAGSWSFPILWRLPWLKSNLPQSLTDDIRDDSESLRL